MPESFVRPRWLQTRLFGPSVLLLLIVLVGGWLVVDFSREADRIAEETAQAAVQKSQLMSRSFGDTFLATDYVLRDVIGRIDLSHDLVHPTPRPGTTERLQALLQEKVATVVGLEDLVLLNGDCIFVAVAKNPLRGTKSRQRFCDAGHVTPGQSLSIQYMPREKSASHRPVVLMSRTVGSADGVLLGAAMAVVDLQYAQQWIAAFEVGQNDVLTIVDTEGTLLARNPHQAEALGRHTTAPAGQPSFAEVGNAATFTATSPIDGRERIFGLSRLENLPFVAIVGFDKARVLAGWQRRAWQFAIGFCVLALWSVVALRAHLVAVRQGEQMRLLAITDALTGIANRRQLMEVGQREVARARRHGRALSVLILDIDKFKSINDRWGHPTGDRVIQTLARVMQAVVRSQDTAGRLGGEEFAVILPETDASGAWGMAERLREAVEANTDAHADDHTVLHFTASIGTASLAADDASFDTLLQRADQALYQAKAGGRNRVVALTRPA